MSEPLDRDVSEITNSNPAAVKAKWETRELRSIDIAEDTEIPKAPNVAESGAFAPMS